MCSLSELLTAKRVLPRGDQATSAAKFVEAKSERLEATSNNSRESSAIPSAIVFPSGEKLSVRTIAWKEALAISWPEAILQSKTSLRDLTSPHQPLPVANVHDYVNEMVPGTWLQFKTDKGPINARLTWISPLRSKYIFTSRARTKAIVVTPEELAWQFGAGKTRLIVEPVPLFDRAVSAALDSIAARGPPVAGSAAAA